MRDIKIKYFDTVPVATGLVVLRSGFLFVASEFSNQYAFIPLPKRPSSAHPPPSVLSHAWAPTIPVACTRSLRSARRTRTSPSSQGRRRPARAFRHGRTSGRAPSRTCFWSTTSAACAPSWMPRYGTAPGRHAGKRRREAKTNDQTSKTNDQTSKTNDHTRGSPFLLLVCSLPPRVNPCHPAFPSCSLSL